MPSNNELNYIFNRSGFVHTKLGGQGVTSAGPDQINDPAIATVWKPESFNRRYAVWVPRISKISKSKVVLCWALSNQIFVSVETSSNPW